MPGGKRSAVYRNVYDAVKPCDDEEKDDVCEREKSRHRPRLISGPSLG